MTRTSYITRCARQLRDSCVTGKVFASCGAADAPGRSTPASSGSPLTVTEPLRKELHAGWELRHLDPPAEQRRDHSLRPRWVAARPEALAGCPTGGAETPLFQHAA